MTEREFQKKAIKWLKSQGAYVIKPPAGPGTPVGCPDVIVLYKSKHCEIEFKKDANAPFRPGQKATLSFLAEHNLFVFVAYPENWEHIQKQLLTHFF